MIELRTINEDNFEECLNLKAIVLNEDFVDPVVRSLAEAWVLGDSSRPFAIYADGVMVGSVLMYVPKDHCQIINFMVDTRFQKRGYGTSAAKLCVEYLHKECNAYRISLPVNPENIAAQKLWSSIGFKMSEDIENGYVFMRLTLPRSELDL